jgi:hypothetical protein
MKHLAIIVVIAFFVKEINAQISVKLYANVQPTQGLYTSPTIVSNYTNKTSVLAKVVKPFSIAINKKLKNNRFVEIELGQLKIKKENLVNAKTIKADTILNRSYETDIQSASCRLEYGKQLFSDAKNRWTILLSQSIQPNYTVLKVNPISSNTNAYTSSQLDVAYNIIPHIQYTGNKRLGVDINFPLYIFKAGCLSTDINNYNLPETQRKWSVFNFDTFNANTLVSMRVGIVYKL